VTQDTLEATLCREGGYTDSVRPPRSYTDDLKPQIMAAYGLDSEPIYDYELDHPSRWAWEVRDPRGADRICPDDCSSQRLHGFACR